MERPKKIDPKIDRLRQFIESYNNLVESAILKDGDLVANSDYQTGLAWDKNSDTLSINLKAGYLPLGSNGKGISPISRQDLVREELERLDLDPSELLKVKNKLNKTLSFRFYVNDLRKSLDHQIFKLSYVQEMISQFFGWVLPIYYWNEDSSLDDNGTTIIKPDVIKNTEEGRWILSQRTVLSENVKPTISLWVGDSGDDINSGDWLFPMYSLQTAIQSVEDGATIFMLPGEYSIDSTITIDKRVTIKAPYGEVSINSEASPALILRKEVKLENIRFFNSDSANSPIIEIRYESPLIEESESAYNISPDKQSEITSCYFESLGDIILAKPRLEDSSIVPLDREVTVAYLKDCQFNTPDGSAVRSTKLSSISIESCYFWNCHRIAEVSDGGIIRVFNSQSYRGFQGVFAHGDSRFRNVAYLKEQVSDKNVSTLRFQFYQTEVLFLSDDFFPRPPVLLKIVNGDFSDQDAGIEIVLSDILEKTEENGDIIYNCQLLQQTYINLINEGARFEVFQVPYIEVSNLKAWRLGEGTDPNQQSTLPNPDNLTFSQGRGIINTYQTNQV